METGKSGKMGFAFHIGTHGNYTPLPPLIYSVVVMGLPEGPSVL